MSEICQGLSALQIDISMPRSGVALAICNLPWSSIWYHVWA